MSDEYFIQNPTSHKFYRNIAYGMTFTAVGKQEWWGYEPNKNIFVTINAKSWLLLLPIVITLEIIYGYTYFSILKQYNSELLFFISLSLYCAFALKIIIAQQPVYKECLTCFMKEFHLYHFQDIDEFNKKIAIQMERTARYVLYYFMSLIFLDASLWVFTPLAHNIMNIDKIHNRSMILQGPTYMWMPFDYMYNLKNWLLFEIFLTYLQFGGCIIIFCVDGMTYTILFHLIGHLSILKHQIENQKWAGLSDSAITKNLVDTHNYYVFIKQYFKTFESAYGVNIGAIYLFNLFADSLLMYQLMFEEKENQLLYLLMAVYFVSTLVILSYAAEEIRKLSEDVHTSIYCCPWQSMSVTNQKIVVLMLVQSHTSMNLKSCGLPIGYQPMIGIMKTTFSYYVMLKNK